MEANAWQMISLKRFGGSEAAIQELIAQRANLAATPTHPSDDPYLTCGLVRSDWPIPPILDNIDASGSTVTSSKKSDDEKSSIAPVQLVDIGSRIGLDFQYDNGDDPSDKNVLLHQLTGGGIGVIDLELDGWPDLYLTQAGGAAYDAQGSKPNVLLRNRDGQRFIDVTESAYCGDLGYGQGVAVADMNQDGFPDLVVANVGPNRLYINQGDGTFTNLDYEGSESTGRWTTSIAVGDLSGDALPEVVEINYVEDPTALTTPCTSTGTRCNPNSFKRATNVMWSLTPQGQLVRSDHLWRGGVQPGYGYAAVIANFDETSGNDLFIANDTVENFYWLSHPSDHSSLYELVENAKLHGCAFGMLGQPQGCMGVANGDFDRNGRLDLHVTNFWEQPADLYLQRDNGFFAHASQNLGIDKPSRKTVAWGTQAADFDRNGWLDLAVLNGHVIDRTDKGEPLKMKPQLFLGDASGFQLMTTKSNSSDYWNQPALGRTMAIIDWNRDLKPDIVCNHLDVRAALLQNQTESGNGSGQTQTKVFVGQVVASSNCRSIRPFDVA